jgi:leucyl aminopeptidase
MRFRPLDLRLSSDLLRTSSDHLVFEIGSAADVARLKESGLPEAFVRETEKLRKKGEPFTLSAYFPIGKNDSVHAFSSGGEDRFFEEAGKFLRGLSGDVAFRVASGKDLLSRTDALALSAYAFDTYKTPKDPKAKRERRLTVIREERTSSASKDAFEDRARLLSHIRFARDLVNTPACDKIPEKFVKAVLALPWQRTEIEVLKKADLERLGFGCLLAVAAGSDAEPYALIFRRKSAVAGAPKRALIGKGLTFDAGGLQIKPDDAMADMKMDMAGAAAVIGAMAYLDGFDGLSENVVAAVGITENLLGGSAMKPMDIVLARNGKTVEIGHTDAEGRLVLADVMSHVVETEKPDTVVTVATLTGACIYGLGYDYAGMVGDDAAMKKRISKVSEATLFERFWELPLDRHMADATKGEISDYVSISSTMKAGASMGAAFLANFRGKAGFVHLDIAGTAWRDKPYATFVAGGTGFGVATLAGLFRK